MILTAHPTFLIDGSSGRFYSEIQGLKGIGYWKVYAGEPDSNPAMSAWQKDYVAKYASLPDPKDFIDNTWSEEERRLVASFLKGGKSLMQWRGYSGCRLCKIHNGSMCLGDSVFVWPQGFAHYVEAHNVRPPKEFIDHVKMARSASNGRFEEPMPTEADHQRMREMEAQMDEERRHAIEAGERLPPISVDLWPTKD